jgi:serine/threonine protein kinase
MKSGDTFHGYQLLQQLGEGGMGEVWLAIHPEIKHWVAIKILRYQYSKNPASRERLRIDAEALARLKRPHKVAIHGFIGDVDQAAIVTAYLEGSNLEDDVNKKSGPWAVFKRAQLAGPATRLARYSKKDSYLLPSFDDTSLNTPGSGAKRSSQMPLVSFK